MAENLLLIFACSWAKSPDTTKNLSFQPDEDHPALADLREELRKSIVDGRNAIKDALDPNSRSPIPALDRYDGGMYKVEQFRQVIAQVVRERQARVLILSGYYGLLTASERILNYRKELDIAHWTQYRLPEAINQIMESWKIHRASAFLNKKGPYQCILRQASPPNTTMHFIKESSDPKFMYPALGHAIVQFVQSGFRWETLTDFRFDSEVGTLSIEMEELRRVI